MWAEYAMLGGPFLRMTSSHGIPLRTPASLAHMLHTHMPGYSWPGRVGTWLKASSFQVVSDSGVI